MGEAPDISVIVPFFDSERHLAGCIEALLAQCGSERSVEILLIDNGSTDDSAAVAARYSRPVVLSESTPGAYAARNAGLRTAGAPILAFTDADCVVDPDWIAAIDDGMRDPEVAVLLGHCRYPDEASLALRCLGAWENAKTDYVLDRCAPAHRFAYANNMAVRAAVFQACGPFKEWRRAADSELVHRLAAAQPDRRVAYHPAMRVTHMEFLSARQRARRLSLYTQTNSQIGSFRELGLRQRLAVMTRLLTRRKRFF